HLPFYGLAVLCVDDPVVREMLPRVGRPIRTYGIDEPADVQALNVRSAGRGTHFTLRAADIDEDIDMILNLPGKHNVRNALAAIAVALELNVAPAILQQALAGFAGIGRRCEVHGDIRLGDKR